MIKIFKTNVNDPGSADHLIRTIRGYNPDCRVNFVLDDEDKILRVEANIFNSEEIIFLLKVQGYLCVELPVD